MEINEATFKLGSHAIERAVQIRINPGADLLAVHLGVVAGLFIAMPIVNLSTRYTALPH
jgi:hypothetical protein